MATTASLQAHAGDAVREAIAAVARGGMVLVVDDEDRENEGDLIMAAEAATPEAIGFIVRHTSGVVCAAVPGRRLDALELPLMVAANTESQGTAFTVSVDARDGTSTGISAADRAATLRALADPATRADDLARPGHVFPLRYREGGVLVRAGHTEAAVDLVRLAGRGEVGVLCEVVNDDGSVARGQELRALARRHDLPVLDIAELVRYRRRTESLVRQRASARLPTRYGEFTVHAFESALDGREHLALTMGSLGDSEPVLTRVHSECLTGDVLRSLRCDCGHQLDLALQRIAAEGRGVLVYLRGQEGRGIGLAHKVGAYGLQDRGRDTIDANVELGLPVDAREYGIGAQILGELGADRLRLMTNNPAKYRGLAGFGIEIVERIPLLTPCTPENAAYLEAKRLRLGHLLGAAGELEASA